MKPAKWEIRATLRPTGQGGFPSPWRWWAIPPNGEPVDDFPFEWGDDGIASGYPFSYQEYAFQGVMRYLEGRLA